MKLRSYLAKYGRHLSVALFVVFFLPACIVVVEKDSHDDDDYYRRRWQLEFFVYGNTTYEPVGSVYTVSFSNESQLSGRADCLTFEGPYAVGRTSTLSIGNLASESRSCGTDSIAPVFLQELERAQSISGTADELVIHLEGTNNLMRFRPM